jgi:hypothetical protein
VQTWDEPSGNGALAGRDLPPAEVMAADQRITALARWLKENGAEGTLSQLRAAVFTAVLAGRPICTLLPGWQHPGGQPDLGAWMPWPDVPLVPAGLSGTVNLTMPLSAWQGLTQTPGEVAGYGPADAATCRDLAAALSAGPGARWCLTITGPDGRAVAHACARAGPGPPGSDPVRWLARLKVRFLESGTCTHQRESHGYRPSPSLRHLIKIRQRTCSRRGCRRPAIACDDDHTIPYDQGGRTCECNCAPVCRRHHRAKHTPGWHLDQPQPGLMIWTLPHGRSYRATPDPYPV